MGPDIEMAATTPPETSPPSRLKRGLKWGIKCAFSVGILWFMGQQITELSTSSVSLTAKMGWIAAGCLMAYMGIQAISAYKWMLVSQSVGLSVTFRQCYRIYLCGMFMGLFMPSSVGGDIGRAIMLARETQSPSVFGLMSVFAERLTGLALLLVVSCVGYLGLMGVGRFDPAWSFQPWYALVLGCLALGAVGSCYAMRWLDHQAWFQPLLKRVLGVNNDADSELAWSLWPSRSVIHQTLLLSILFHILSVLIQGLLLWSVGAKPVDLTSWLIVAAVYSLSALSGLFPLSLNGAGVREGVAVLLLLHWSAISSPQAMLFSFLWLSLLCVSALLGGVVWLCQLLWPASIDRPIMPSP